MTVTSRLDRVAAELDHVAETRPQWPAPLNPAAYHGITGEFVRLIEPHTEADPAAVLIQFLVAAGSVIGRGPYYQVENDKHHANLFSVLVGDSAKARKGTSAGRIRQVFDGIVNADGTPDPWARDCWQSGLSSGEGLIYAVRDGTGDDPGVSDKRLYVAESEFAGLLRVMTRDGNTISRIVRDVWDRGDLGVMTKSCPTRATNAHISILGHITADELVRYLDRTESCNGFANRFLFVCVSRSKYLPHGGSLEAEDLIPLSRRLSGVIANAGKIGRVMMTAEAAERWEAVYPALSADKPGLLGSVTARGEAQVIRLALVYALLDESPVIRSDHLRAALAVWEYCEASARYIFGEAAGVPVVDQLMKLIDGAGSNGISRTQIRDRFQRHRNQREIDRALELLAKQGKIYRQTCETGGRPVEIWTATRWREGG